MPLNSVPLVSTLNSGVFSKKNETGKSIPLSIFCHSSEDDLNNEYVVKLYGSLDLREHALARELIGALLGQVMGLNIPEVAIIDINSDFINAQTEQDIQMQLSNSPGLNFGSKLVVPGNPIFTYLPKSLVDEAINIFSFDMLIWNVDRRVGKPNMFLYNDELILFDHEMAFPFSRPGMLLGGFPAPWEFTNDHFVQNHILYKPLRDDGRPILFDEFIDKLVDLSDSILDTINSRIPDVWRTQPDLENLFSYLKRARDNANQMKRSLQEVFP